LKKTENKDINRISKKIAIKNCNKDRYFLSEKKLKDITISPKIKNGKIQLDKNNPDHRYIYED